jgi:putative transposase
MLTIAMGGPSAAMSSCLIMSTSFVRAELGAKALPTFMQRWKEWTSKRMTRELKLSGTVWQEEFFDHVLRSRESYNQKWHYVKENPVRAGLVEQSDDWPWQGEVELLML